MLDVGDDKDIGCVEHRYGRMFDLGDLQLAGGVAFPIDIIDGRIFGRAYETATAFSTRVSGSSWTEMTYALECRRRI